MSDAGSHYRFKYKGVNLDPARICNIYGISSLMICTVIKKALCCGQRGHKSKKQDLLDIINACERELEIMREDGFFDNPIDSSHNPPSVGKK